MNEEELKKQQTKMHRKIKKYAEDNHLTKRKPILEPIYDGVADISAYLNSSPRIMWILKEPYAEFTESGKPKGGGWKFTTHFKNYKNVWHDQDMWKLMIQINFAIRNHLKWSELDFIEYNPEMAEELKKIAYINVGKMPGYPESPLPHMQECYNIWEPILKEQIELYNPEVIIFGYTFYLFYDYFQIEEKPITTVAGNLNSNVYKKKNRILIDAYHPSRKGGENSSLGKDYVTSIVKAYEKMRKK